MTRPRDRSPEDRVLRLGVMGLGAVAQAVYLPLLARRPERFRVDAVCDLSPTLTTAIGERYGVPRERRHADLKTMLDAGGLDALLILSSGSHAAAAVDGLDAGLSVLCEKPLAYTLDEVAAIRRAAGNARRLQLGYMKLYDPAFRRAATMLEGCDVRSVEVTVLHPTAAAQLAHARVMPAPEEALVAGSEPLVAELRRCEKRALGSEAGERFGQLYSGILLGSIVHDLAMIRALVGDPVRIEAAAIWPDDAWPPSVEIAGVLPDGSHLSIRWHYLARYPAYREELAVHHEAGSIALRFPAPYLLNAPTDLTVIDADAGSERTTRYRSTTEAFEEQLLAFWRMTVAGDRPAAAIDEGEADVRTCQRIVACLAGNAGLKLDGEAAAADHRVAAR